MICSKWRAGMLKGCNWILSSLVAALSVDRAIILQLSKDYKSGRVVVSTGVRIPTEHQKDLVWDVSIESVLRNELALGSKNEDSNAPQNEAVVGGIGSQSYLYSTINVGSNIWGLVGIHAVSQVRVWGSEDKMLLHSASGHIANILTDRVMEENTALQCRIERDKVLLQRVVDSTPVYLGIKDRIGKFILVNKALSEAAGYASPIDMIGIEGWGDYFPLNSIEEELKVLSTGKDITTLYTEGKDKCFNCVRKYVVGANGLKPMVVSTLIDITEVSTITKRLEEFTYIASHDLQEPLRTITSFLGLLKKRHSDELSGSALGYVDIAIGASKRMGDLLSDLLTYSRISGKDRVLKPVSIADILMKALRNISGKLSFEVCPTIMYDPNSFPNVWGDEVQLTTCMQNLLSNAIKFGEGSPVEIEHSSTSTHWEITVTDYGVGVPTGMEEAIFKPFKRAHSEYEGTGMGLAIVQKVAHMHNGEAWVTETPGGGATMHLTIMKPTDPNNYLSNELTL